MASNDTEVTKPNMEALESLDPQPMIQIQSTVSGGQSIPISQPEKQVAGVSTIADARNIPQTAKQAATDTPGQPFPLNQLEKKVAARPRPPASHRS
jgi:hypothetical protein